MARDGATLALRRQIQQFEDHIWQSILSDLALSRRAGTIASLTVFVRHAQLYYARKAQKRAPRLQMAELRALLGTAGRDDMATLLAEESTSAETVIDLLNHFHGEVDTEAVEQLTAWLTARTIHFAWRDLEGEWVALLERDAEALAAQGAQYRNAGDL